MSSSFSMLSVFLTRIPVILVMLTAIILAIVFWRKHPNVSLFTVIGCGGNLILNLVGTYISTWLPMTLSNRGISYSEISVFLGIWSIASSILNMVFWGLIIAAIFGWRNKPSSPSIPPVYSIRR